MENDQMAEDISVAYGSYHLNKDVDNAKTLKELLAARDDYERLTNIEVNSCRELDVKVYRYTCFSFSTTPKSTATIKHEWKEKFH